MPVDMCNATNGRPSIAPDGTVTAAAESDFENATCFTQLEAAWVGREGLTRPLGLPP
jgi:hypothetical protein